MRIINHSNKTIKKKNYKMISARNDFRHYYHFPISFTEPLNTQCQSKSLHKPGTLIRMLLPASVLSSIDAACHCRRRRDDAGAVLTRALAAAASQQYYISHYSSSL